MHPIIVGIITGLLLLTAAPINGNFCAPAQRSANLGSCLFLLKVGLNDKARFWFGSQYDSLCPGGPDSSVFCTNDRYTAQDSIGTRIFRGQLKLSLIQKYVEVHYYSEQGSFSACGNDFDRDAWQGEIIPTSSDVYQPWFLRDEPVITWDANDDELYTIVFYDVGHFVTHMVVVNIPGNNVSDGEVKYAYVGPDIAYDQNNPYAFFLYSQANVVNVSAEWTTRMSDAAMTSFSIPDFTSVHDMTGPVAVNWVVATGDEYAAQIKKDLQELYTCPLFVREGSLNKKLQQYKNGVVGSFAKCIPEFKETVAMDRPDILFIPETVEFSVGMEVTFISEPLKFNVCCIAQSWSSKMVTLNPFRSFSYASNVVASSPIITLRQTRVYTSSFNFTGELFTLALLDTTPVGDTPFPDLRYFVINIADGNLTTGDVIQSYRGALNEDPLNHVYQFMLYRQGSTLNASAARSFLQAPCPQDDLFASCSYDIKSFVEDDGLNLVGANWMMTSRDYYTMFVKLNQSGPSAENATCFGMPGYPCKNNTTLIALLTTPLTTPATTPLATTATTSLTTPTTTPLTTTTPLATPSNTPLTTPITTPPTSGCRPVSKAGTLEMFLLLASVFAVFGVHV